MDSGKYAIRRGLIPEDLLKFSWLQEIALSPGGDTIAYTVRAPDAENNGYQTTAYLASLQIGSTVRIAAGNTAGALAWKRDGTALAFVTQTPDGPLVEIVTSEDHLSPCLTLDGHPPEDVDWSPDGKRLVFARWTTWRHAGEFAAAAGVPAPSVRVIRRLRYKLDGIGWVEDRYRQIWVLDVESGHLAQITDEACDHDQPVWT